MPPPPGATAATTLPSPAPQPDLGGGRGAGVDTALLPTPSAGSRWEGGATPGWMSPQPPPSSRSPSSRSGREGRGAAPGKWEGRGKVGGKRDLGCVKFAWVGGDFYEV